MDGKRELDLFSENTLCSGFLEEAEVSGCYSGCLLPRAQAHVWLQFQLWPAEDLRHNPRNRAWLLLVQEWNIPKDTESRNPNCFKWSIFLSCFHTAFSFKICFLLFWFLGFEWEDSSFYFLDVYVQHPEFIHRATSLPLKIRAKSGSNLINISSFALQTQRLRHLIVSLQVSDWHHITNRPWMPSPKGEAKELRLKPLSLDFQQMHFMSHLPTVTVWVCSISVFVRPKPLHKLLVFYTKTFLEILRRDCSAACLGCSLCYTIKVPSEPMLGQKHLCSPWRHHLEMYSVIQKFWSYWASLTDHVTGKLQTIIAHVSTQSTISVALSHSKGGWKLKLNASKNLGNSLNWKKDTCKITHFVYPGIHVHRATLSME